MTADADIVKLFAGGTEYSGWKSVRIETGIERQARSFDLEVTSQWPGKNTNVATKIKQGDAVQVKIGSDLVLTGYVDATPIRYDGKGYSIGIKGRSKTADLVDCCPVLKGSTQWRSSKMEKIAQALAKAYGINVIAQVSTGANITDFSLQQGETVFETIDRMMRIKNVLSTDNENGDLVFIKVAQGGHCSTILELGQNIRSGTANLDYKDVFSDYTCLGQASGDDSEDATIFAMGSATTTSTLINRKRAITFIQSGQIDSGICRERVLYEASHRAAKALETDYVVSGWREQDGTLWMPNRLVKVRDGLIGFDQDMLIAAVTYVLDADGLSSEIKVGPSDGYMTQAEKKPQPNWGDVTK